MKLNYGFAKTVLKKDGTPDYAPAVLTVVTHHHEEWDEPVIDPDTGEPTGETEHKSRDWDTKETKTWPTADDYRDMGYADVVDEVPSDPAPEGHHWEARGWEIDHIRDIMDILRRVYVAVEDPPAPPRVFETADLVEALMAEGIYQQVHDWVVEKGLLDLVLATKEFDETNANFQAGKAAIQEALGWTDEEVEELLAKCVKEGV